MLKDNQLKNVYCIYVILLFLIIPTASKYVFTLGRSITAPRGKRVIRCRRGRRGFGPRPSHVGGKSAKTWQNNVCVCRLDYLHSYPTFLLLSPRLPSSLSLSPLDNYPTNCRRERYGSYRWGKLGRRNVRRAETDRLSATTLAAQTLSFVALTVCSPGSILALPAFPRSLRGSAGIKMPLVESIPEI